MTSIIALTSCGAQERAKLRSSVTPSQSVSGAKRGTLAGLWPFSLAKSNNSWRLLVGICDVPVAADRSNDMFLEPVLLTLHLGGFFGIEGHEFFGFEVAIEMGAQGHQKADKDREEQADHTHFDHPEYD